MKASFILQILAAVALATADDLTPPECAAKCLGDAVEKSGCATTDYVCQCTTKRDIIVAAVIPCIGTTSCTNADLARLQAFSTQFCPKALSSASASAASQTQSQSQSKPQSTSSPSKSSSSPGTSPTTTPSPSPSPSQSSTGKPSGADANHRPALEAVMLMTFCTAAWMAVFLR